MSVRTAQHYLRFYSPLEALDDMVLDFAQAHAFYLQKNQHGRPIRVLQKLGEPTWMIALRCDQTWHTEPQPVDLTYSIGLASLYQLPSGTRVFRKDVVAEAWPLPVIASRGNALLQEALDRLQRWEVPLQGSDGLPEEEWQVLANWSGAPADHPIVWRLIYERIQPFCIESEEAYQRERSSSRNVSLPLPDPSE